MTWVQTAVSASVHSAEVSSGKTLTPDQLQGSRRLAELTSNLPASLSQALLCITECISTDISAAHGASVVVDSLLRRLFLASAATEL